MEFHKGFGNFFFNTTDKITALTPGSRLSLAQREAEAALWRNMLPAHQNKVALHASNPFLLVVIFNKSLPGIHRVDWEQAKQV